MSLIGRRQMFLTLLGLSAVGRGAQTPVINQRIAAESTVQVVQVTVTGENEQIRAVVEARVRAVLRQSAGRTSESQRCVPERLDA